MSAVAYLIAGLGFGTYTGSVGTILAFIGVGALYGFIIGLGTRLLQALFGPPAIFISLAISPARVVLQWPQLLQARRMIGVGAFAYGFTHLSLYFADEAFDVATVASEIVLRIYLTIGFSALLGLAVLAITSTDG